MIRKFTPILLVLAFTAAGAEEPPELDTDQKRFSYAVGYQIGQSLKRDGLDVETAPFLQALEDVLSGADPKMTVTEMRQALQAFQQQKAHERQAKAEENKAAGEAFLAENRKKEGVQELPSGLQYEIIKEGTGKQPAADDTVVVHYRGQLLDGTEFDSSFSRGKPTTLPVSGVIKGWQEALQKMREGAEWKLFVPPELAYGEKGAGKIIGPNETLVFDVELIEVK